MQRRMVDLMRGEGLPYGERLRTCNSRFAQELGKWADSRGEDGIHDAIYRAYFAENRNIGEVEELVRIAETVGLPGEEARDVLMERCCRDAVDADWVKARRYGVTGVPTFVAGSHGVVGAQPYDVLEQLVRAAGATLRSSSPSSP